MEKERDCTLDIIRIVATFTVISVHFFLNTDFYNTIIIGKRMYVMVLMRTFFMICVPLFLILTGYLTGKKELNKKYYYGIRKTLCIYVLASFSCMIYKQAAGITDYDLKHALFALLDFSGANYSWYIEMYIGLFLLIPFLNTVFLYSDHKKRKILIITFLLLTSLPTFLNIYNFDIINWWANPILSYTYQKIIPFYWHDLWPITYFFIGCYLREYQLKYNWRIEVALVILITLISGTFNFYRSYNSTYISGAWQDWNGFLNVILSTLVFHLILQIKYVYKFPITIKKMLKNISDLTLGAYLVSSIFDSIFYNILNHRVHEMPRRLEYFIIIVPLVFICSILLSYLLNKMYQLIRWIAQKIRNRLIL